MGTRREPRQRGILPVKIHMPSGSAALLAHTVDLSVRGVRVVVTVPVEVGTSVFVEYRHRRAQATVVWIHPIPDSKFEHEAGLQFVKPDPSFWGALAPAGPEERSGKMLPASWGGRHTSKQTLT